MPSKRRVVWASIFLSIALGIVWAGYGGISVIAGLFRQSTVVNVYPVEFAPTETNLKCGDLAAYFDQNLQLPSNAKALPEMNPVRGSPFEDPTRMWLITNDQCIRIIAYCGESDFRGVKRDTTNGAWDSDGVEIFLTNSKSSSDEYYQIIVSFDGRKMIAHFNSHRQQDKKWTRGDEISVKNFRLDQGFMYDVVIPFSTIQVSHPNDLYFQLIRNYRGQSSVGRSTILQQCPNTSFWDSRPDNHDKSSWEKITVR